MISYPTVGLFALSTLGNLLPFYYSVPWWYVVVSAVCVYGQFTVAHDAVHRSVASNKTINNSFGVLSQFWLGPTSNWHGLKVSHLEHHKHTNDPDNDPDYWSSLDGPGGMYLTPFRWLTIDFKYTYDHGWLSIRDNPIEILYYSFITLLFLCAYKYQFLSSLLKYWVIPSRIALFFLAFAFDFLPHYPHNVKKSENRYLTTSYLSTSRYLKPLLSLVILYQNYHVAHHLNPSVPFYRYKDVWESNKEDLLHQKQVPILHLTPFLTTEVN